MSYARRTLDTYPRTLSLDADRLATTIDALSDCAQACTADTDADLSEDNLAEMVRCIRLCLDCADICTATAGILSRLAEYDASATRPLLQACAAICASCGDECEADTGSPGGPSCLGGRRRVREMGRQGDPHRSGVGIRGTRRTRRGDLRLG
jgi:hypothetical protein